MAQYSYVVIVPDLKTLFVGALVAKSGDASSTNLVVLVLSVAAGALGLLKGLTDYLQTKRSPSVPEESRHTLPMISLETTDPSSASISFSVWRIELWVMSVIAGAAAIGSFYFLIHKASGSFGYINSLLIFTEGGVGSVLLGWIAWQIRGKKEGDWIDRCVAEVVLKGGRDAVVLLCRRAMWALRAIRAEGMTIITEDRTTKIAGGRGSWPRNNTGQRVTAIVDSLDDRTCRVEIESVTLWPSIF
jgi:hypothetical protein